MQTPGESDDWTPAVHRRTPFLIGFVLVVVVFALIAATGAAHGADVEIHNETVDVDADTDRAWAEVENAHESAQANLSVTMTADDNGSATEVFNESLVEVPADDTTLLESSSVNGTENDTVRVVAVLDNETVAEDNVSVDSGTFQQVGGGSGGIGGSEASIGIGAVVVVLAVVVLMRRD